MSDLRSRTWATIVYPESAPETWIDLLRSLHIPCYISPLHDKDLDETGKLKKPHYHGLFLFNSKKSKEQFEDLIHCFGGVGSERISSKQAYIRYLCHLDDPDKYQYNIDDVLSLCGATEYSIASATQIDSYGELADMIDFIENSNIVSFSRFVLFCRECKPEWFRHLANSHSIFIKEFLTSRKWDIEHPENASAYNQGINDKI